MNDRIFENYSIFVGFMSLQTLWAHKGSIAEMSAVCILGPAIPYGISGVARFGSAAGR
ncbi:hypothetical protein PSEUDO8O_20214 [Pseudomonas sp. 8O]|nr:hypothetical protein PSEUDO8O_20214 [Pseudomonas sp. 8O]